MSEPCLIHQLLLDGHGGAVSAEGAGGQPDQLLWSHIEYSRPGSLDWLISQEVPEVVAEAMVKQQTRPRVFFFDQGTLINLRGVNLNPGSDPEDMVSIRVWLEPTRIITARQRRISSVQDIVEQLEGGKGPKTTGEFLVLLVEKLASHIGDAVDDLEEQLGGFEDFTVPTQELRAPLGEVRRRIAALRRFLAPQREALDGVYRASKGLLDQNNSHYMREQADRITRYVEDLDLARERALVVQEELQNRVAQEQNSRSFLLTIVATVFLPLGFLTGLFGMNVAGLPGTENPDAFKILTVGMVIIGFALVATMRWKRWW